jgi:hypothetical protein
MTATTRATVFLMLLSLQALPLLAQGSGPYKGRLLAEVLQELQSSGLRIVFSSAIVQSDLRVSTEPRAKTARQRLEELLEPHGLSIREGPGGTLQVVQAATPRKERQEKRGSLEGRIVDAWTGVLYHACSSGSTGTPKARALTPPGSLSYTSCRKARES